MLYVHVCAAWWLFRSSASSQSADFGEEKGSAVARWMKSLQESHQLQELLMDSDGQCQSILRPQAEAKATGEPLEMNQPPEKAEKTPERAVNPFAKPQADPQAAGKAVGNPFQTKFAQMSPKAGSVHLSTQLKREGFPWIPKDFLMNQ